MLPQIRTAAGTGETLEHLRGGAAEKVGQPALAGQQLAQQIGEDLENAGLPKEEDRIDVVAFQKSIWPSAPAIPRIR